MTALLNESTAAPNAAAANPDWDLDLSIVESGPVVEEMMRLTDDGCGSTCESACNSCA
ncbi:FxLD family lanthipeptide [Amycolatopsis vastitatis]|uniref:FxLD family lantipeptide n=1 Tax=Amycolatopsis vastitatis TaxID=1905142 RepID=A0A229SL29_9PSEU|nr:FxLD family lanthipeptide [Amycolatopsis vastitatis]OXM59665.1 FxLD family lantipeptide [Amycolatopsis vastitatis]